MKSYHLLRLRHDEVNKTLELWSTNGWVVDHMTTSGEIVTLLLSNVQGGRR